MTNVETILLIVHTLIALAIIGLVLLQRGKGAEAGAAFGAGASGTVFGARGSTNFFSRTTAVLATLFFASSLALAYFSSQDADEGPQSLIESAAPLETGSPAPEESIDQLPDLPDADSGVDSSEEPPALDIEEAEGPPTDDEQQ